MSEFLQGLLASLIVGTFFLSLAAMFKNSGRHAAQERIEEDRRQYFPDDELSRRRQTRRATWTRH